MFCKKQKCFFKEHLPGFAVETDKFLPYGARIFPCRFAASRLFAFSTASIHACPTESSENHPVGHGFFRAVFLIGYGFRGTHSVGFPRKNHPPEDFFSLPSVWVYKSVSLTAVSDHGSAFGFRKPLKRLDRNFQFRRSRLFAFFTASINACPTDSEKIHLAGHGFIRAVLQQAGG